MNPKFGIVPQPPTPTVCCRASSPAAVYAWDDMLKLIAATAFEEGTFTVDDQGNVLAYIKLDPDEAAILGAEHIDRIWIGFEFPTKEID